MGTPVVAAVHQLSAVLMCQHYVTAIRLNEANRYREALGRFLDEARSAACDVSLRLFQARNEGPMMHGVFNENLYLQCVF